ncbi:MAG: BlaI/MecI/CopY family transcriptional regulator [Nannocystaceae bacterium]|nr:BlaI/MecI/CopY family transcriptional regulator [Nannocystaceae bacterium]
MVRKKTDPADLSRRERQIMDVVYRHEQVSAGEVREAMPEPPSYSAVRALLRILEEKGHLTHETEGMRYVYRATRDRRSASRAALKHVVQTFFEGSAARAAAALLQGNRKPVSGDELEALQNLIRDAADESGDKQ